MKPRSIEEATRSLASSKGYEIEVELLQGGQRKSRQLIVVFALDGTRAGSFATWEYAWAWARRARNAPGFPSAA